MSEKKITASSVIRVAGNIASGLVANPAYNDSVPLKRIAETSVELAYLILGEVEKVENFNSEKGGLR